MRGYRKLAFGLAIGLPYLLAAYALAQSAIVLGRDLTATGIMLGAIGTALVAVMGVFVWGNKAEPRGE